MQAWPQGTDPRRGLGGHDSADQLSRFGFDSQGIDHFVKRKNEKYANVKEKLQETYDYQGIKIYVQ